ncbi:MAG: glycosyltransferase family 4 protein [Pseudomonadota bacterium]
MSFQPAASDSAASDIAACVVTPDDAGVKLRAELGLAPNAPLRISYIPGPGNLTNTYEHWRKGAFDPRTPSIAYATMFFELAARLDADLHIVMRGEPALSAEKRGRVTFSRIPQERGRGALGYWRSLMAFSNAAAREAAASEPHIAVAVANLFWPALHRLKSNGTRVILTAHTTCWPMGVTPLTPRMRIENLPRRYGLRAVDASLNISPECARQVAALTGRQLPARVAFPQQIARPCESGDALSRTETDGAPHVIFLGRIVEYKGVFDLAEAFAALRRKGVNARLTFAGRGPATDRLNAKLAEAFPDGGVELLGHLDAAGVHDLLRTADVLVCPTRTSFCEGNAAVCFEAATHGVPAIVSTVVPAREFLEAGVIVFRADDAGDLTNALERALTDPELRKSLSKGIKSAGEGVYDRSRSWGSQLFLSMMDAAAGTPRASLHQG